VVTLALGLSLGATGCEARRAPAPERAPGRTTEGAIVRLEETLNITQSRIEIDYRLENPSSADLYVLDALFTLEDGRPAVRDSLVYTLMEGDSLRLVRAALPIPQGVQVEAPEMPYARRLPAGGTLAGRIAAPLPLRYQNPYDLSDGDTTWRCVHVRLVVGYAAASDLPAPPARVEAGGADHYRIPYRAAMSAQKLVESRVHDVPITVYRHP
jgi:hypothetical protein